MPADQEESYDDDYAADKPFEKVKGQYDHIRACDFSTL
jgi:hypothetical protein